MGEDKPDFTLKELDTFIGTTQYHSIGNYVPNIKFTDGIAYIAKNGYDWLISDLLPLLSYEKKLKSEKFLVILLKEEKSTFTLVIKDKNNKQLYKHKYNKYHDLGKDIEIHYQNNILTLPSEN